MNVDEAMAIGRKEKPDWYFNANEAAPILAAEVERLRAEVDFHSEACKGLIAELAEKKAENDKLRAELAAAKDQYHELSCAVWACSPDEVIPDTHQETVNEAKRDVIEAAKLRLELAAAKAASVCPVTIKAALIEEDADGWERIVRCVIGFGEDAELLVNWLEGNSKKENKNG